MATSSTVVPFGAADAGRPGLTGDRVKCRVASPFHVTQLSGGEQLFPAAGKHVP